MNDMREAFEKAVFSYYGDSLDKNNETGNYNKSQVQVRWELWQECWQSALSSQPRMGEGELTAIIHNTARTTPMVIRNDGKTIPTLGGGLLENAGEIARAIITKLSPHREIDIDKIAKAIGEVSYPSATGTIYLKDDFAGLLQAMAEAAVNAINGEKDD